MTWNPVWFADTIAARSMLTWRGVAAQYLVATLRLVDTPEEQQLLESLLETSKPALPITQNPKHYLLTTPFRYRPAHASRFRPIGAGGQWYGAETIYDTCAELAYWRHRFLLDSAGLQDDVLLTEHSLFQAHINGLSIDLTAGPWIQAREAWTHSTDYRETQALAAAAQQRGVQWLRYESARAPGTACAVAFTPDCLFEPPQTLERTLQRWVCKTTRTSVMFSSGKQSFLWRF